MGAHHLPISSVGSKLSATKLDRKPVMFAGHAEWAVVTIASRNKAAIRAICFGFEDAT